MELVHRAVGALPSPTRAGGRCRHGGGDGGVRRQHWIHGWTVVRQAHQLLGVAAQLHRARPESPHHGRWPCGTGGLRCEHLRWAHGAGLGASGAAGSTAHCDQPPWAVPWIRCALRRSHAPACQNCPTSRTPARWSCAGGPRTQLCGERQDLEPSPDRPTPLVSSCGLRMVDTAPIHVGRNHQRRRLRACLE